MPKISRLVTVADSGVIPVIEIKESILWSGWLRIRVSTSTRQRVFQFHNLITDPALNLMRDALRGLVADLEIKYVALGTSNTAPAAGDVVLGNEVFRKAVTKDEAPGTGQAKTVCYVAPYEALQQIEEIGFFAGAAATAATNSGILVARVLFSRLKNELESWQIERTDSFARA
ncbi:MAG: hypothetical protein WD024_06795 [Bacillota bacterium]